MDIVILGAGGHGRELHSYIEDVNSDKQSFNLLGFVDDSPARPAELRDLPVLGGSQWLERYPNVAIALGIGDGRVRKMLTERFGHDRLASIIHPTAYVSRRSTFGPGFQAMPHSVIADGTTFGVSVLVNVLAVAGHDNVFHDFVTIAPRVTTTSGLDIGEGVDLFAGATVIPGVRMGAWSRAAAGATVTKNVDPGVTVYGVPARTARAMSAQVAVGRDSVPTPIESPSIGKKSD